MPLFCPLTLASNKADSFRGLLSVSFAPELSPLPGILTTIICFDQQV